MYSILLKDHYDMYLDKFECRANPQLISNISCRYTTKPPHNQMKTFSVDVMAFQMLDALLVR